MQSKDIYPFTKLTGLLLILCCIPWQIHAQVPTDQDCLGAIHVCDSFYTQQNSYTGTGNYPNEIPTGGGCPGNCMLDGEKNDVWYRITVQTDGMMGFVITPNQYSDDYDWVVYNLTYARCEHIQTQASSLQVSCNWSAADGPTGPNGQSSINCGTASHGPFNALIPVNEGETYVINVSNWSSTQFGYTLDFSPSTAQIYDNVRPKLGYVHSSEIQCGDTTFTFDFSEVVLCTSVNQYCFELEGPDTMHAIVDVTGEACEVGAEFEVTYTATIDPPFTVNGNYFLRIVPFSAIQDACNNIALPQQKMFVCDLGAPTIIEDNMTITSSTCGQENGAITGLEVEGNGPFTYEWLDASYNVIDSVLDLLDVPAGQYTLIVDDPAGCQSIGGPYQVNDDGAPTVDTSLMEIIDNPCEPNDAGIIGLQVTGTEPFTFEWYNAYDSLVGTSLDLTGVTTGFYTLKIVDDNSCESFAGGFTVLDFSHPEIIDDSIEIYPAYCGRPDGSIRRFQAAGTWTLEYRWFNAAGDTVWTDLDLINAMAGSYTLLARDSNNCVAYAGPYTIPEIPGPAIDSGSLFQVIDASCGDDNGAVVGLEISGQSDLVYQWIDGSGTPVGDTTFITGVGPGTYTLSVTDEAGCETLGGPYEIHNIGGVSINATIREDATCELANGQITITAAGGVSNIFYSIDDGMTWHTDNIFQGLLPGTYNILVKDTFNCVTAYTGNPVILNNQGEAISVLAEGDTPVCTEDDLQLMVDLDGATYSWWGPDGFISSEQNPLIPNVGLEAGGVYTVVVIEGPYSCKDTSEILIQVLESFPLDLALTADKNPIYPAEMVTFTATASVAGTNPTYEWLINDQVVYTGNDSTYTTSDITASCQVSCRLYIDESCADPNPSSATLNMQVMDILIYFPNSFKPTSTQGNHIFKALTTSSQVPGYELIIFNRWGQKIFQTPDLDKGWDGTIDGEPAPEGVYVWMITYEVADESFQLRTEKKKGTVLLLR